jgi:hypothetical protein
MSESLLPNEVSIINRADALQSAFHSVDEKGYVVTGDMVSLLLNEG